MGAPKQQTMEDPLLQPFATSLWFVHPVILKAEETLEIRGLSFFPCLEVAQLRNKVAKNENKGNA